MKRTAILVDASYVRAQLRTLLGSLPSTSGTISPLAVDHQRLRVRLLQQARAQLPDGDLLRVYWYDAPGPAGKTDEHHAIDALDDVKLRLGAHPVAGQPVGLTGLITADLLGLAQHRAITHALVVSDDAGLSPGVLAVQAMGVRVDGLCLGPATAASAALAADWDTKCHWSVADLHGLLADGVLVEDDAPLASAPALLAWAPAQTLTSALSSFASLPALAERSSGAAAVDVSLAGVAQAAHAHLQDGPHEVVFAALKPGMRALPREIDGALLAVGRQTLGRALTEPEKRELRREFQGVVKRAFEDRLHPGAHQPLMSA